MRQVFGKVTPNQKIAVVNPSVVKQQGTSRALYHFLPYSVGTTTYEFFENLNNTAQMFKNIDQNKLTTGEALAIKKISIVVMTISPNTGAVVSVDTPNSFGLTNLMSGKIDLTIGNQTVIKDLPTFKLLSAFNPDAKVTNICTLELESDLILEREIEFKVTLKHLGIGSNVIANAYVGIMLDGYGKIFNGRKTI